jgi:hypothetical protein
MHCWSFSRFFQTGRACYVSNYGFRDGAIVFGDPVLALDQAAHHDSSFATVAMVYWPPASAANAVQFMVYNATGGLQRTAQLDAHGSNVAVPNNCIVCHGDGRYDASAHTVTGARFLPFDVASFQYADLPGLREADQVGAFAQLNNHVLATEPSDATLDFLTHPSGYVPDGWKDPDNVAPRPHEKLYFEVVAPYCRTCHMTMSGPLSFSRYDDFYSYRDVIKRDVCESHEMPQSEHTADRFWRSPARAHLIGALQLQTACTSAPPATH